MPLLRIPRFLLKKASFLISAVRNTHGAETAVRLGPLNSFRNAIQGQVKRAYQQLNVMKVRNDYLEHKLQQYLEEEQSAVLGDEDEDGDEIVVVGGKWD